MSKAREARKVRLGAEQDLLASPKLLSVKPFVPPKGFVENIDQFHKLCTPHVISRTGYETTLLSFQNKKRMFFLIKDHHVSPILRERGIIPGPYCGTLESKGKLPSLGRLDFKIQEAFRLAQEAGAKKVVFAWRSKEIPLATALVNQKQNIIGRGQFPVGPKKAPLDLIEVRLPKAPS